MLKPAEAPRERRIAAVVLPELLCEIAEVAWVPVSSESAPRSRRSPSRARVRSAPFGVVLLGEAQSEASDRELPAEDPAIKPTSKLDAVNFEARRFGVRAGQSIAEACAILAKLSVRSVTPDQVRAALGRVAEIALGFGPTVAIELPDTVWVDITGAAHLMGGEAALTTELASRVRDVGHVTRVAVASGPRLSRAFACWSTDLASASSERASIVVAPERTVSEFERLPLAALPIEPECAAWFLRLGVLTVGDLAALPRASATARLGKNAGLVLELCQGRDSEPLVAYEPPRVLVEETTWDDGVNGAQPLLFVLRGLASRMSARLAGRGEAAKSLRLVIDCDANIARLNGVPAQVALDFELAVPLWREQELGRIVASRLERQRLEAPSLGLRLEVHALASAQQQQLDLSRVTAGSMSKCLGLEELPVLLGELAADIGKDRVGVLSLKDSLRPENKCALVPAFRERGGKRSRSPFARAKKPRPGHHAAPKATPEPGSGSSAGSAFSPLSAEPSLDWPAEPTRLLRKPVPFDAVIRIGATVAIDHRLYSIEKIQFEQRLDAVEWWSRSPVARDYLRLWLSRKESGLEAIVYVDRETGARFLQAIVD